MRRFVRCRPALSFSNLILRLRSHASRATWAVADQGIGPLVQLALTPYLLNRLGKADFAVWVLANTLLTLSQLVSCGAGIATTKHVSADLAIGAKVDAIAATRAALTIAILGGGVAALLTWIFAPEIAHAFFAHMGSPEHVAPVIALSGFAAAIQELDNVYAAAMRGAERFDLCAIIEVPARVAMGLVIAFVAWRTTDVYNLFVAVVAMMILKAGLKANQARRLFNATASFYPSLSSVSIRRVLRFGLWQWMQSAGTMLFSATDQLIVGSLLGASALTRYSICLQIAQYVHVVPSVMMQIIFPRVSALGPRLDVHRGNQILRSATLISTVIAAVLGLPIIIFARPLLGFWIGRNFAADNYWLLIALVLVHISLATNIGAYFVLLGSNRAKASARIVLLAGAVQSVFAVLVAPFGILPVACNRFLYALITAFLYRAARFKSSE
jgi:O-antigen/teichoic acid export membrane protein